VSGWLATIFSIGLSIYLYRRSRLLKRIDLIPESIDEIGFPQNVEAMQISFNGASIGTALTRAQFTLKNSGNTGVEKTDIRDSASIDVEISNGRILGAYIGAGVANEVPKNALSMTYEESKVILDCNYIDPGDSFPIVIYSTGKFKGAKLRGKFKAGVVVKTKIKPKVKLYVRIIMWPTLLLILPLMGSQVGYGLYLTRELENIDNNLSNGEMLIFYNFVGMVAFWIGLVAFYFWVKYALKSRKLLAEAQERIAKGAAAE
jgi:hypothetical protein